MRFEQSQKQCFLHISHADNPGSDAVDAGVKEVKTDEYAVENVAADKFFSQFLQFVVEFDYMVAVLAYRTAYMESKLVVEQ